MTLKELKESIDYFSENYPENTEIMVCDDGMKARFFPIDSALGTSISRLKDKNVPGDYRSQRVIVMTTDLYNEVR